MQAHPPFLTMKQPEMASAQRAGVSPRSVVTMVHALALPGLGWRRESGALLGHERRAPPRAALPEWDISAAALGQMPTSIAPSAAAAVQRGGRQAVDGRRESAQWRRAG